MAKYVIAPLSRLHEGEGVLAQMPRFPLSEESQVNESFFYIDNTLVPSTDGSRILGPYNREELKHKRDMYDSFAARMPEGERNKFPFVVFELKRTE